MNLKRTFGALLTLLGTVGLIASAVLFVNTSGGARNIKMIVVYGALGFLFFVAGIGLVRNTKDEA